MLGTIRNSQTWPSALPPTNTAGPRLRAHINVFVAGEPADLDTAVGPNDTVHVIPAVSGG